MTYGGIATSQILSFAAPIMSNKTGFTGYVNDLPYYVTSIISLYREHLDINNIHSI